MRELTEKEKYNIRRKQVLQYIKRLMEEYKIKRKELSNVKNEREVL